MTVKKSNGLAGMAESLEMEIGRNIHELTHKSVAFPQPAENGDGEKSAADLGMLLRRVSEGSMRDIEGLIDELHGLRKKLETDGNRILSDIARHSELSQGVMQLTAIITDNVKRLPG
jgi:hypothetical protein